MTKENGRPARIKSAPSCHSIAYLPAVVEGAFYFTILIFAGGCGHVLMCCGLGKCGHARSAPRASAWTGRCSTTWTARSSLIKAVFPNDLHFKIACTGCSNDCAKARMHDFGIIGMTLPQYDPTRCVSCQACIKGCKALSVNAADGELQDRPGRGEAHRLRRVRHQAPHAGADYNRSVFTASSPKEPSAAA